MLDLRLNHSGAEEATEDTNLSESMFKEGNLSGLSFDDQQFAAQSSSSAIDANSFVSSGPMSPTIPIPTTSANRIKFDTIDCEIGSKKSNDGNEFMPSTSGISYKGDDDITIQTSAGSRLDYSDSRIQQQYKISEMSAESLLWLSHRLGPVLTARYLTRNLLKMLTLCYVGQENLLPDYGGNQIDENNDNLINFSIAEGRIVGDRNAIKVLECLTSITGTKPNFASFPSSEQYNNIITFRYNCSTLWRSVHSAAIFPTHHRTDSAMQETHHVELGRRPNQLSAAVEVFGAVLERQQYNGSIACM